MVYIATNKEVVQSMLGFYYKFVLPLFIIFFFLIHPGAFGFYLVPIYLLAIFFPVLIFRWKIIVLFLTILVITINTDARSNVIKFSVPFLLLPIYYYRDFFTAKVLEKIRIFFVILPIFLFMLGAFGYFNIFKMDDYINQDFEATRLDDSGQMINTDMKADTRTGLYEEVLKSATMHNYYLIGRTPGRGNDSEIFSSYLQEITGKDERISNEVAILNVFTWTGIVGVILYFFIFFKASYLAVNRSKNIYSKMLGIFIAFRWSYAWVEDINNFSLTYFMLMILLGLCFSTSFRNMTDNGIYFWVRGIFDYRYRIFDKARKNSIKTAI
jgi:hypothetical protein